VSQPVTLPLDLVVLADSMLSWARHRHNWPADVNADMDMAIRGLRNAARPTEPETREPRYEGTPVSTWVLRQWVKQLDEHGTLDPAKTNLRTALFAVAQELEELRTEHAALRSTQQGTRADTQGGETHGE